VLGIIAVKKSTYLLGCAQFAVINARPTERSLRQALSPYPLYPVFIVQYFSSETPPSAQKTFEINVFIMVK
jgi:hypothetical protein